MFRDVREQVSSDLMRYADQGWKDSTLRPLSLRFEYHIDRARLTGGASPRRVASANQYAQEVTTWAQRTFATPEERPVSVRIIID